MYEILKQLPLYTQFCLCCFSIDDCGKCMPQPLNRTVYDNNIPDVSYQPLCVENSYGFERDQRFIGAVVHTT
jgi:hypothetical protein